MNRKIASLTLKGALCLLLCLPLYTWANILDSLRLVSQDMRENFVAGFYNRNLRYNKDSMYVIQQLKLLLDYAQKNSLQSLECSSYSLLADHYARMRQYNDLSSELHKKAINKAKQYGLSLSTGMALYKAGRFYYNFKHFSLAFEHLLLADQYFEEVGYHRVPEFVEYLYYMGNIYNFIGQTEKASFYFERIEKVKEGTNRTWFLINAYANMAIIHQNALDYKKALFYTQKVLYIAQKYHYPDWITLSKGNLGVLYFKTEKLDRVTKLLEFAILDCIRTNDRESASGYLYYLINYYIKQKELGKAKSWFKLMDMSYKHRSKYTAQKNYYEIKAQLAEIENYPAQQILALKQLQIAKDSLEKYYNKKLLYDIQIRTETDAHLANLKQIELRSNNKILVRNILLVTFFVLIVLVILGYIREKSRRIIEKKLFVIQKKQAENELESAKVALQNFKEKILEKNDIIQQITKEVELLKDSQSSYELEQASYQLYHKTILTSKDWEEFKSLFEKVYPNFFYRQKQYYPQLTPGEVRLLALLKLQFSSSEMALILGVSPESVKKSKQRLRKKLQTPDKDKSLEELIEYW